MAEFTIKGRAYRSGKMDLRKSFFVRNRIAVVYPAFAGAKAVMGSDPILAAGYITSAMRRLSDEDWAYVIDACLDLVQVQQGSMMVPIKTQGASTLQFADMTLDDVDLIVFNVLFEHYAPFIGALPSLISAIMDKVKTPE